MPEFAEPNIVVSEANGLKILNKFIELKNKPNKK